MKTPNTKILITALSALSLLFIIVLAYGIYDIRAKNAQASTLLREAEKRAGQELINQSIRITENNVKEELALLDNLVLREEKLVALIEDLEASGKRLDLEVRTLSVSTKETQSEPQGKQGRPNNASKEVLLSLEATGGWDGIINFLRVTENLPYRIMISETNLAKRSDDWYLKISFSLHLFD